MLFCKTDFMIFSVTKLTFSSSRFAD